VIEPYVKERVGTRPALRGRVTGKRQSRAFAARPVHVANTRRRTSRPRHTAILITVSIVAVLAFVLGAGFVEPDSGDGGDFVPVWQEDEG
jgi:hypothetical protein